MIEEELGDTKRVIRICKSKENRQHNGQKTDNTMAKRKMTKKQTKIYKTIHIKLKIE